jgi:hypothetical protein
VTENPLALLSIDTLVVQHRRDAYATLDTGETPMLLWTPAHSHSGCISSSHAALRLLHLLCPRPKKMVQRHNDQENRSPGCDREKRIYAKQVQTAGDHL